MQLTRNELNAFAKTWDLIWRHPISSRHRTAALGRWMRWQVGSRILPGGALVPFVNGAKLLVRRGMVGATGNIYMGLHEFEEMAFAMHLMGPNDLMVDVGANVGSYSIIAASKGARCISVEPIPATYADLVRNVSVNSFQARVSCRQVALGATSGTCEFTSDLDAMNHVVAEGERVASRVRVDVTTLDSLVERESPTMLKVDVEGYETEVFRGGMSTLGMPSLTSIIIEMNQSGNRYGYNESEIAATLVRSGFEPCSYAPFERRLVRNPEVRPSSNGNAIFVRQFELVQERLRSAPAVTVFGVEI